MANNGLITLQTDLKSLKYSSVPLGSANPYVSKDIGDAANTQTGLEITSRIDDTTRIAKMLIDKPGIKYLLHEAQLQQINTGEKIRKARKGGKSLVGAVLGQLGNTLVTTAKIVGSTLVQVPVNGTGTHFLRAFRTDTYLQPSGGNTASKFAQFFGAGGVEGAPLALQGKPINGVAKSQFITQGSTINNGSIINPNDSTEEPKFAYNSKVQAVGQGTLSTNEKPNTSLPEDDANRLSAYNAVEGNSVTVGYKKPTTFGKKPTKEIGDISPTVKRGVQTTATPGVQLPQNSIKSTSNRVNPKEWISPDSIHNISSASYSYNKPSTGTATNTAILNAQAGAPIPVGSIETTAKRDSENPQSSIQSVDKAGITGSGLPNSLDNLPKTTYSDTDSYTGYSTEDNIRAALNNKIVGISNSRDAYRETQADWPTNGGVGVDETTNQNTNKTVSYGTKGEASIPKPKRLNVLAREINTGSVTPVSRDGSNIPYVAELQDFRSGSLSSYAYNYNLTTVHKEHRIGLGNQGRAGKNRTNYMITHELDRDSVNYQSDTTSRKDGAVTDSVRDLAKFFFEIITPDAPSTYLYFRAFIESIDDGYSATWNAQKYVGRAEDFYTYGGFSREISISFTIAAATRDEMKPLYRKMVYLASATAPTYGNIGLMRGTLARLTVGSYLSEIPGVITSVKYTLDNTMPWEIAMSNPDGGGGTRADDDQQELPMMLKCSVSFKPIHDFAPQTGLYHYFTAPQENLRNGAVAFFTPPAAKAFTPDAPLPADKENGVPPGQSTTQVKADTKAYNQVMENTFKPGWVTKPNPYGP